MNAKEFHSINKAFFFGVLEKKGYTYKSESTWRRKITDDHYSEFSIRAHPRGWHQGLGNKFIYEIGFGTRSKSLGNTYSQIRPYELWELDKSIGDKLVQPLKQFSSHVPLWEDEVDWLYVSLKTAWMNPNQFIANGEWYFYYTPDDVLTWHHNLWQSVDSYIDDWLDTIDAKKLIMQKREFEYKVVNIEDDSGDDSGDSSVLKS